VLKPLEFNPGSRFPEQVWCQILDSSAGNFFLGVCYHTPTDNILGPASHDELKDLLSEIGGSKKHFLLMGDFNYSFKRWPPTGAPTAEAHQFAECLDDNFFYSACHISYQKQFNTGPTHH